MEILPFQIHGLASPGQPAHSMLFTRYICSRLRDCATVVYSGRCYSFYPVLGWLCHPRQVLGFLLVRCTGTNEYKGEWGEWYEFTTPATANYQTPLAMSDTFDSTRPRDRPSLSPGTVAYF